MLLTRGRIGVVFALAAIALLLETYLILTFPTNPKGPVIQVGDLTRYVNPFIGTSAIGLFGGGDTFPGAATPMGMVQWSPDTPSNPPGGYSYDDSHIKDFSLTHFSGRTQLWTNTPGGIPGNDDAGEMSAWHVFATMGLYPEVTAVGGFVVGSPLFTSMTVHPSGGRKLQVNAPQASDVNLYVQNLKLNGNSTTSLWVPWNGVKNGATLDFQLTGSPTAWGSGVQDAPPSYPAAP